MPLPLVWLGAGLAALYAGSKMSESNQKKLGAVAYFPGESSTAVEPQDGAIVSCGIYGMFEHTGIWIDGNIVELKGNGLIRAVSPSRFIKNRSGDSIFVACDHTMQPLVGKQVAVKALAQLFQYSDYHVINNNCHRFVYTCLTGNRDVVTSFADLNKSLYRYFHQAIHWQPCIP